MATPLSLTELVTNFSEFLKDSGKSSLTIVAYQNDLHQLMIFLGERGKTTPETVMSADLEAFKNALTSKNYTAKSIARKLNAVKGFFRWLQKKGTISEDPAAAVAHPKYELSSPRILSPLEYRALRDAARDDSRISAIVELLLQTGMRISEVANVRSADIHNGMIMVSNRDIPLNEPAKRAVDQYLRVRAKTESEHLFVTKTGRPLLVRNIRAAIERCFAEAGIENATVNDIRNTFIVHQLAQGVDLVTVSHIVGHRRLATTERYLALIEVRKKSRQNGLSEL